MTAMRGRPTDRKPTGHEGRKEDPERQASEMDRSVTETRGKEKRREKKRKRTKNGKEMKQNEGRKRNETRKERLSGRRS